MLLPAHIDAAANEAVVELSWLVGHLEAFRDRPADLLAARQRCHLLSETLCSPSSPSSPSYPSAPALPLVLQRWSSMAALVLQAALVVWSSSAAIALPSRRCSDEAEGEGGRRGGQDRLQVILKGGL